MSETTYHAEDDETLSETIIRGLSALKNTTALHIQPLYDSIDPEVVDTLFDGRATSGQVTFTHAGYRITVHSTRKIRFKEIEQE